jgi:hypothetical protein
VSLALVFKEPYCRSDCHEKKGRGSESLVPYFNAIKAARGHVLKALILFLSFIVLFVVTTPPHPHPYVDAGLSFIMFATMIWSAFGKE